MANLILTPEWVDGIYQLETSDPVMGGPDGIDNRQAIQLGKRTEWLKKEVEKQAPKNNPAFTGTPTAPTPEQSTNNQQIATTEFVKTAIAALVGSAPAALDTLAELANALGNDSSLKQVLLAEIGNKANKSEFTSFLDLFIGVPIAIPTATLPEINIPGYTVTALDGGRFSTSLYPKLAKVYPSGVKPDARGEFIRGWDNGRGVDRWRVLLSEQGDAIRNITAYLGTDNGWIFRQPQGAFYDHTNGQYPISARATIEQLSAGEKSIGWISFDASRVVPTANENRPRNIAYQYVCLAA